MIETKFHSIIWTLQIVTKSEFNVQTVPQQIIAWTQNMRNNILVIKFIRLPFIHYLLDYSEKITQKLSIDYINIQIIISLTQYTFIYYIVEFLAIFSYNYKK